MNNRINISNIFTASITENNQELQLIFNENASSGFDYANIHERNGLQNGWNNRHQIDLINKAVRLSSSIQGINSAATLEGFHDVGRTLTLRRTTNARYHTCIYNNESKIIKDLSAITLDFRRGNDHLNAKFETLARLEDEPRALNDRILPELAMKKRNSRGNE